MSFFTSSFAEKSNCSGANFFQRKVKNSPHEWFFTECLLSPETIETIVCTLIVESSMVKIFYFKVYFPLKGIGKYQHGEIPF
jgi:hypothetical protein